MSDETTTEQLAEIEGQGEPIQVREGRWRTRNGSVKDVTAMPTDHEDFAAAYPWWDGVSTWRDDGRWLAGGSTMDLVEYLGPIELDKTQELDGKTQELQAEYTPPEGWRVLAVGEELRQGDMWVWPTDDQLRQTVHIGAVVGANQRYIRPIEPDKPQPQPAEYTPPDGWRVLAVGEMLQPGDHWVNWEGTVSRPDIQHGDGATVSGGRYIRWVKPQPQPEPNTAAIEELRSEVSYVQRLLGESNRKVTQLEELVTSLRAINEAQEKAFNAAGKANTDLQHRLNVVAAEWAEQAETIRRLQIELDAAQQVPADSPELRQLRADLEQMTLGRDTYRDGYERVLSDLRTIRETTKSETVEAIAEWLQAFRGCNSPSLALLLLEALPSIMRTVTGLADEEIE